MCSYLTVPTDVAGSAKGPEGWFSVTTAQVYFDHPFHAPFDHTLNIDFIDPSRGPGARVAVELSAESARRLVQSIEEALATIPTGRLSEAPSSMTRPKLVLRPMRTTRASATTSKLTGRRKCVV